MSLPQCIEGCPQYESTHKTRVRHKQRHRSRTGVQGGSRASRVSRRVAGGFQGAPGRSRSPKKRSNIQDFVQEVPVGQMAQGTPFRCPPWPDFKVVRGGTGRLNLSTVSVGGLGLETRMLNPCVHVGNLAPNFLQSSGDFSPTSWTTPTRSRRRGDKFPSTCPSLRGPILLGTGASRSP